MVKICLTMGGIKGIKVGNGDTRNKLDGLVHYEVIYMPEVIIIQRIFILT